MSVGGERGGDAGTPDGGDLDPFDRELVNGLRRQYRGRPSPGVVDRHLSLLRQASAAPPGRSFSDRLDRPAPVRRRRLETGAARAALVAACLVMGLSMAFVSLTSGRSSVEVAGGIDDPPPPRPSTAARSAGPAVSAIDRMSSDSEPAPPGAPTSGPAPTEAAGPTSRGTEETAARSIYPDVTSSGATGATATAGVGSTVGSPGGTPTPTSTRASTAGQATPTTARTSASTTFPSTLPSTVEVAPSTIAIPPPVTATSATVGGTCRGRPVTISGSPGNDKLLGTPGPDVIDGGSGDDEIHGLGGDDVICGGNGMDELWGDDGDDVLAGGNGFDILHGGPGNDTLDGGNGKDAEFQD
jgi:Ca2+-binding RTX toxin-like protein